MFHGSPTCASEFCPTAFQLGFQSKNRTILQGFRITHYTKIEIFPENFQKAQSQVSKYVNVMGIIQLLEAITYAPLVGVMADYLEVFFSRWSHDLHPRVASLRANSVCLAVCSLFGFISAVAPCIGKISEVTTNKITPSTVFVL